jgi:hypothetical protein
MALGTAIVGAVAGGNLVLILLDMLRAGSAGDRVASRTAVDIRSTDGERPLSNVPAVPDEELHSASGRTR